VGIASSAARTARRAPRALTALAGAGPDQCALELGRAAEVVSISWPCGVVVSAILHSAGRMPPLQFQESNGVSNTRNCSYLRVEPTRGVRGLSRALLNFSKRALP
jgi:hypothetical protein